jgi:hypothetical protein
MLEPGFLEDKFFYWIYVGFHKKRINQEKQYKVLFSGGTKSYDRKVWLLCFNYFSKLFFIQSEIFLVNYTNPESRLDRHQYLELLSKNQISFSLSAKTSTKTLITFRALESLSLGCTLIQQEFSNDKPLSNHFVPYKHYLPFETVEDLAIIFKLISLEPLLIKQIGNAALEFWNNHYSEKFRWHLLIDNITLAD